MATIVLQAAGAWLGGVFGAVGSAVGSAAGALAGYMVDRALLTSNQHYEGPRLASAHLMAAEEGSPLPRVYGTVRVGGALIWATRFEERSTTTRQGAKGGPKQTTYSYYANVALALCEGEIAGVRRIWADGRELDVKEFSIRVYKGDEAQAADPLIEAKQGAGNAPGYRGIAYVVFERFPIDDFGRRIPQFQFEVLRPGGELRTRIRSVALIPGATEYGLSPTLITSSNEPGETIAVNRHNFHGETDFEAAIDELQVLCPNLDHVSLVVSWFGTDLRAGYCRIKPMVVQGGGHYSQEWRVCGIGRGEAQAVSLHDGAAAYGGTPSDKSLIEAIRALRARGLKVSLYPFIMMDIPAGNDLSDPYGDEAQAPYPWRGRITCHPARGRAGSPDKTVSARAEIDAFAGTARPDQFARSGDTISFAGDPAEWSFRRHILHYAYLASVAGGVDGFIIGSEMPGLTGVRAEGNSFPFVEILTELAADVRAVLGGETTITYAADWSEYFGYHPQDGTGDVFFHLDCLWSSPAINCIGIDNYMPLADWRDEDAGGADEGGFGAPYDMAALKDAISSGEGFDWYYASDNDRWERSRSAIQDGGHGKHWVFRYKDLVGWWSHQHFNRIGGVEEALPTGWVPKSKPFHFTELGCAAVDKGPNQPNVFPDPKSAENGTPYFSNGGRSDLAQYRFLLAHHQYWQDGGEARNPVSPLYGGPMVDPKEICVWAWDLRPFPAFPLETGAWGDGANWGNGHWLNGRISSIPVSALIDAILADHKLPAANTLEADGMVGGYVTNNPTTARAALEPIVDLFGIGIRSDVEKLVFATLGRGQGAAKTVRELVLPDDGDVIARTRIPDHSLPAHAQLDFRDQLNEHQSATAAVNYPGAKGSGTSFVSFPGVLAVAEANALINDFLHRTWDKREQIAFSLPITRQDLCVGNVLRLEGERREYVVAEIEEGLVRRVRAEHIARKAAAPAFGGALPERAETGNFAFGRPHALLLDLPLSGGGGGAHKGLRIAARAKPWKSQAVYTSPEETGFSLRTVIAEKAVMGRLLTPLATGEVEGRFELAAAPVVELLDGELQSVTLAQLLNGANAAAVLASNGVWEILQFQRAEETEINRWKLSCLLRGQLGTNDAMSAGAEVGAPFVLLNEAVIAAGLKPEEVGLELNWRVGPMGYDLSETHFASSTVIGGIRALRPLSPVHMRGKMESGALHLSWMRRGRVDADSWLGEDIALGEEAERYLVEIYEGSGVNRVRSVNTTEPRWVYGADLIVSDFGAPPETIVVRVSQISAFVGPGIPARRSFRFS